MCKNKFIKTSVCIPTYNQALYIEKAIRSCVEQSVPPFEIIVSDDCSTDKTGEILKRLSKEIPILKVVSQPVNLGMVANTDAVLRTATGDFIVKLDSDDYLEKVYIEKLLQSFQKFPDAGYAHAAVQEIDEQGAFKRQRFLARKTGYITAEKALKNSIKGYQVAANIIMFRRAALHQVGYITAKTNFAEDYYLSVVLAAAGFGNIYMGEILSYYRVWNDTGKVRQRRKLAEIIAIRRLFEEVLEPAFTKRGWDLEMLERSRTSFACIQADCLGWTLYNSEEKRELEAELNKLSSSPRAIFFAKVHLKKFGKILIIASELTSTSKSIIKALYLSFQSSSFKRISK